MIPLRQVVSGFETSFEDEIVNRRDRKRTMTIYADPEEGLATALFERVRPQVEALPLPPGYQLEWGGELHPGIRTNDDPGDHHPVQFAAPAAHHMALCAAGVNRCNRRATLDGTTIWLYGNARFLEPDGHADQERDSAYRPDQHRGSRRQRIVSSNYRCWG